MTESNSKTSYGMDELLQARAGNKEEAQLYEVGFHLVPTLSDEALSGETAKLKDGITAHQGVVISEGTPQRMNLAYKLPRILENVRTLFDSSYFGWVRFEMLPRETDIFERELKNNPSVVRFILLKVQPEKMHAATRKMPFLAPRSPMKEREKEEKIMDNNTVGREEMQKTLSEAELDKTIEELIAE